MAEASTLARPYAQAVFEIATSEKKLAEWSAVLHMLAAIVENPTLQASLGNPNLGKERVLSIVLEVSGAKLSEKAQSFVRLLVENGRLVLVPAIAEMYDVLKAQAEATLTAEVTSATDLSKDQRDKIAAALKRRFKREVVITTRKDETLVGGAIIRAGDIVIDGSVRGHLDRLANTLSV